MIKTQPVTEKSAQAVHFYKKVMVFDEFPLNLI